MWRVFKLLTVPSASGNTEDNGGQGRARLEPALNRIEVAAVAGAMVRVFFFFSFFPLSQTCERRYSYE